MKGRSGRAPDRAKGRTDWKRIARLTDAQIERMAARDAHNPATRKDDWANAFIGVPPLKAPVNAKFDVDVVECRGQCKEWTGGIFTLNCNPLPRSAPMAI